MNDTSNSTTKCFMLKQELIQYADEMINESLDASEILSLGYSEVELRRYIEFLLEEGARIAQRHIKDNLVLLSLNEY